MSEETVAVVDETPVAPVEGVVLPEDAPVPMPKPIEIPEPAKNEIVRLYQDLTQKDQAFNQARMAFLEFIRVTKVVVGVPTTGEWDVSPDASHFFPLTDDEVKNRQAQAEAFRAQRGQ